MFCDLLFPYAVHSTLIERSLLPGWQSSCADLVVLYMLIQCWVSARWQSSCFLWVMSWLGDFLYANSTLSQQRLVLISPGLGRHSHSIRRSWRARTLPTMSKQTSVDLPNVHADNPVGKSVAVKRKRGRPARQTRAKLDETVKTASTSAEHSCGKSSAAKRGRRSKPVLTTQRRSPSKSCKRKTVVGLP